MIRDSVYQIVEGSVSYSFSPNQKGFIRVPIDIPSGYEAVAIRDANPGSSALVIGELYVEDGNVVMYVHENDGNSTGQKTAVASVLCLLK